MNKFHQIYRSKNFPVAAVLYYCILLLVYYSIQYRVLFGYPVPDFQSIEKPKEGPLEIENFFVGGG